MKHTAQRISKILDGRERHATSVWKPAVGALTFFMVVGATAVEHTPQLVGFENSGQSAQIALSPDTPSEPAGHVVPAVARVDASEPAYLTPGSRPIVRPMGAQATLPARGQHAMFPRRVDVNFRPSLGSSANGNVRVFHANASEKTGPQFMLVVFQTQQSDNTGNLVVRTYVWRVPIPMRAWSGLDPRST